MKGLYKLESDLKERETPKNPIKGTVAICPNCKYNGLTWDDVDSQENYCPACGQALGWFGWD